jgi:uncharacterized protein YcfJ
MKKLSLIVILIISLALGGCAGMSDTEQRTLSGAAIGTAAGGIVGAIAGHTGIGLAVGAVAGTAGGYLYDHHKKAQQKAHDQAYDRVTKPAKRANRIKGLESTIAVLFKPTPLPEKLIWIAFEQISTPLLLLS